MPGRWVVCKYFFGIATITVSSSLLAVSKDASLSAWLLLLHRPPKARGRERADIRLACSSRSKALPAVGGVTSLGALGTRLVTATSSNVDVDDGWRYGLSNVAKSMRAAFFLSPDGGEGFA